MPRKRQNCEAFKVFDKNVDRSQAFLNIFEVNRTQGRPTNDEQELLVATIVMSIGALDAFLHDLVLELVPRFGGDGPRFKAMAREIAKQDPGLAIRMQYHDESPEAAFQEALSEWLNSQTFHGTQRVKQTGELLGFEVDFKTAGQDSGVQKPEAALDRFTKHRHAIVHRGVKPQGLRKDMAADCLNLVWAIGGVINDEAVKAYHD